jgi:hypothetical protein
MLGRSALVVVAALSAATLGATSGAAGTRAVPPEIRLVSTTTSQHVNDKPPKGQSAGDTIFATSRLQNLVRQFGKARGATVGHDSGTTTLLDNGSVHMDGVATLPGGTVHFRGTPQQVKGGTVIPVVGGTGRYDGVTGTLTITDLDQIHAINIYRLKQSLVA